MRSLQIVLVVLAIMATGCNLDNCNSDSFDKSATVQQIDSLEKNIKALEQIQGSTELLSVIELYHKYADNCPKDSLSPKYLFKSAQMELSVGESIIAIQSLDTLVVRYPKSDLAPSALQFKAFILDDRMRRWQKAAEVLDYLIATYPESEIIENAKAYKLTLGKSPEQIIFEMEQKNNANNE